MTDRRPGQGVSKPDRRGYRYRREFYRDAEVAAHYDEERFEGRVKRWRNRRKWRTVVRALETVGSLAGPDAPMSALDLPCGTGRFTGHLAARGLDVVASDVSLEMMREARRELGPQEGIRGWVQADAEALPFASDATDCCVSIRFMHHVTPSVRVRILREMGRVCRWLVVDYRHRYSYRWVRWRIRRLLGKARHELERVSRSDLDREFRDAGLEVVRVHPVFRFFSDKWVVVGRRA